MNVKKSAEDVRQWEEQVRRGGLQSFTHFRRLVKSERPWTEDDRQGMLHLLDAMEESLIDGWKLLDELKEVAQKRLTRRAGARIRGAV